MTGLTMPLTYQQERYSLAYVRAVASAAGYCVEETRLDIASVDLSIMQYSNSDRVPVYRSLQVQLKCTYHHKPKNGFLSFPLKIKNYNDLRARFTYPTILVVVYTPQSVADWVLHSDQSLDLHHCGYWISLRGMPETDNSTSVTVPIPLEQRFSIAQLTYLMDLIAEGEVP